MVLQVIEALGNMKPKQFVKTGLVKEVVLMLCSMTAEPLGEDEDEEDDTNELPAPRIASQVYNFSAFHTRNATEYTKPFYEELAAQNHVDHNMACEYHRW